MKKTIVITLLLASGAAFAGGATLCPIYEYAELQSMSTKELSAAWIHDGSQIMRSNDFELENCTAQMDRIRRVQIQKCYSGVRLVNDDERELWAKSHCKPKPAEADGK